MKYYGTMEELPVAARPQPGVVKKVVFGPEHLAQDEQFVVRRFELEPGAGTTERHVHPWAHWMMVREGKCHATVEGHLDEVLEADNWLFVPGGVPHTMYNESKEEPAAFICIVRPEGN